jgi:hypothetical protein
VVAAATATDVAALQREAVAAAAAAGTRHVAGAPQGSIEWEYFDAKKPPSWLEPPWNSAREAADLAVRTAAGAPVASLLEVSASAVAGSGAARERAPVAAPPSAVRTAVTAMIRRKLETAARDPTLARSFLERRSRLRVRGVERRRRRLEAGAAALADALVAALLEVPPLSGAGGGLIAADAGALGAGIRVRLAPSPPALLERGAASTQALDGAVPPFAGGDEFPGTEHYNILNGETEEGDPADGKGRSCLELKATYYNWCIVHQMRRPLVEAGIRNTATDDT